MPKECTEALLDSSLLRLLELIVGQDIGFEEAKQLLNGL
jgi:hypothetical protein